MYRVHTRALRQLQTGDLIQHNIIENNREWIVTDIIYHTLEYSRARVRSLKDDETDTAVFIHEYVRYITPIRQHYTLLDMKEPNKLILSIDPPVKVEVDKEIFAEISRQKKDETVVVVDCYLGYIYRFRKYYIFSNTLAVDLQKRIDVLEDEIKHYPESDYILGNVKERFEKQDYKL